MFRTQKSSQLSTFGQIIVTIRALEPYLVSILKALVESLNPRGPPMTAIRLEAFLGFISQILKTFLFCFNGSQV